MPIRVDLQHCKSNSTLRFRLNVNVISRDIGVECARLIWVFIYIGIYQPVIQCFVGRVDERIILIKANTSNCGRVCCAPALRTHVRAVPKNSSVSKYTTYLMKDDKKVHSGGEGEGSNSGGNYRGGVMRIQSTLV